PWAWHKKIQTLANDIGLDFFSSPFDFDAVEKLESLNVPYYKIASLEITDIPLIQKVAQTGKPVIISIGIAEEEDIELAVKTVRDEGNNQIALLKCTSAYPTPYNEINLKAIPLLRDRYKVISGLSDHTLGISVPIAAAAIGAKIIEKHFIFDKNIPSVDRDFSLDPDEFKDMVDAVRQVEQAMGEESLKLSPKAKSARVSARSLFIIKDLKKGDILTEENVKSLRPGMGLHPKYYYSIIGKRAKIDIEKGTPLQFDLIQ
ncbi:MAG: pseudaminic acid synthase, partial [Bacteroidales bacterium]|nr:pseudaminic acid synthase [Bacteroidales bacterium]